MSRFKHDFEAFIELMFQQFADRTEPVCQAIDTTLARMPTFDTSGILEFMSRYDKPPSKLS